jgi:hypothetical protein
VVEALRGLPLGDSLALGELGVRLREGYTASDLPWLEGIVQGLARDGLARWIAPVDGGERRVALPE